MYTQFFGLGQSPFSIAPDPRFVFMSERHRDALAHLLYGLDGGGGFVLLTGEIGTGKTTVCRLFLEHIPPHCNVAYIFNPRQTVLELLRSICEEFGVATPSAQDATASIKDFIDPLNVYLLETHAAHQNNILIIDEAQNLSADVLEQLRLLTNLETNERKLLQIVLIGQPELRSMLARPELEQLAQRVIARFHLGALSADETARYVAHRMAVSGFRSRLPFSGRLLRRIHQRTGGIPRRINLLCERALLGAYAKGTKDVDARIIDTAAREVFGQEAHSPGSRSSKWRPLAASLLTLVAVGAGTAMAMQHPLINQEVRATVNPMLKTLAVRMEAIAASGDSASIPKPASERSKAAALTASGAATVTAAGSASGTAAGINPETGAQSSADQGVSSDEPPRNEAPSHDPAPVTPANQSGADQATNLPPAAQAELAEPVVLGNNVRKLAEVYRQLGKMWNLDLDPEKPCQAARKLNVYCHASTKGLTEIRQLNRPVVVTLLDDQNQKYYAVLAGLGDDHAALLIGEATQLVTLAALAKRWRGQFYTFWQAPEGYQKRFKKGERGPALTWLVGRMDALAGKEASTAAPVLNNALSLRIREFQLAQGLPATGMPDPETFMRVSALSGVTEPRLDRREPTTGHALLSGKP